LIACVWIRIPNHSARSLFCISTTLVLKRLFLILVNRVSWDSVVGITTRYWLDGPGIEARWGRDFPHSSTPPLWLTQPHTKLIPCHSPRLKRPGLVVNHPPPYNTEVKRRVSLEGYRVNFTFVELREEIIFRRLRNRPVITDILI
jgi:hypothetical protein